jgi:hypothetical protein
MCRLGMPFTVPLTAFNDANAELWQIKRQLESVVPKSYVP